MPNESRSRLHVVPCELSEANAFVKRYHRHHQPVPGHRFSLAVADETNTVRGVAIVGRPVARMNQDGWTLEVNRVATDGCPNACSALYGAAWRAARALGYRRLITYTLPEEGGGVPPGCRVAVYRTGGRRQLECAESATGRQAPDASQTAVGSNLTKQSKRSPSMFEIILTLGGLELVTLALWWRERHYHDDCVPRREHERILAEFPRSCLREAVATAYRAGVQVERERQQLILDYCLERVDDAELERRLPAATAATDGPVDGAVPAFLMAGESGR